MLRWLTPTKTKFRSTSNRKLKSFRPAIESLESRFLLSAAGFVAPRSIVAIVAPIARATTGQTATNTTQTPQACNNAATTTSNTCATIDVLSNDKCTTGTIDCKTVRINCNPCHGTVSVDCKTGAVTYTPAKNFTGCDTFTYTVKDKSGRCSNVGTVCVTVTPPICPPTACNDSATTCSDAPVKINVLANDKARVGAIDPKTVEICRAPTHGTTCVDPCTGEVKYTPASNYCGSDTFTYKVKDCNGTYSNVASVCVTVTHPKQTPEICNASVSGAKNKPIVVKVATNGGASGCTIDWSTLCIVDRPCHGVVGVNSCTGKITYLPNCNYCGSDTFTYQVKDTQGRCSNVATACVTVK